MRDCKKCGKEFIPQKGLLNYCSLKCRNSRTWSEGDKKKKSLSAKSSKKVKEVLKKLKTKEVIAKVTETKRKKYEQELLSYDFKTLSFERLKKRVAIEQEGKCNKCQNSEWMGQKITLELEHKDGNNKNNSRENLESLCPNCHSLTETWRGRNKKTKRLKISDENLLQAIINNDFNFRKALIEVGLSAKGGNYKRCHALIKDIEKIENQ